MNISDIINSGFEVSGGLFMLINVKQILRDKQIKGFHWIPMFFFTLWGFWNLYYYAHLTQWYSEFGATSTCAINSVYLILIIKYKKPHNE